MYLLTCAKYVTFNKIPDRLWVEVKESRNKDPRKVLRWRDLQQ